MGKSHRSRRRPFSAASPASAGGSVFHADFPKRGSSHGSSAGSNGEMKARPLPEYFHPEKKRASRPRVVRYADGLRSAAGFSFAFPNAKQISFPITSKQTAIRRERHSRDIPLNGK
jgi:hypothetical protein